MYKRHEYSMKITKNTHIWDISQGKESSLMDLMVWLQSSLWQFPSPIVNLSSRKNCQFLIDKDIIIEGKKKGIGREWEISPSTTLDHPPPPPGCLHQVLMTPLRVDLLATTIMAITNIITMAITTMVTSTAIAMEAMVVAAMVMLRMI